MLSRSNHYKRLHTTISSPENNFVNIINTITNFNSNIKNYNHKKS